MSLGKNLIEKVEFQFKPRFSNQSQAFHIRRNKSIKITKEECADTNSDLMTATKSKHKFLKAKRFQSVRKTLIHQSENNQRLIPLSEELKSQHSALKLGKNIKMAYTSEMLINNSSSTKNLIQSLIEKEVKSQLCDLKLSENFVKRTEFENSLIPTSHKKYDSSINMNIKNINEKDVMQNALDYKVPQAKQVMQIHVNNNDCNEELKLDAISSATVNVIHKYPEVFNARNEMDNPITNQNKEIEEFSLLSAEPKHIKQERDFENFENNFQEENFNKVSDYNPLQNKNLENFIPYSGDVKKRLSSTTILYNKYKVAPMELCNFFKDNKLIHKDIIHMFDNKTLSSNFAKTEFNKCNFKPPNPDGNQGDLFKTCPKFDNVGQNLEMLDIRKINTSDDEMYYEWRQRKYNLYRYKKSKTSIGFNIRPTISFKKPSAPFRQTNVDPKFFNKFPRFIIISENNFIE